MFPKDTSLVSCTEQHPLAASEAERPKPAGVERAAGTLALLPGQQAKDQARRLITRSDKRENTESC